ncbi:hypothetical protein [Chitinimonas sp. JJ19]|uniref:hypothetical protein n=1 Tax=Chitinimonas sp. JJ19 TaxID=3109352 RepID=UPI002FFFCBB6
MTTQYLPLGLLLCLLTPQAMADEVVEERIVLAGDPSPATGGGKSTVEKRIIITRVGGEGVGAPPLPPLPPLPPTPEMINLHMPGMPFADGNTLAFAGSEFGPAANVKGAPYSAEAISEKVQTLLDGNRIVKRTVTRLYRDGEGRSRQDTLNDDGSVRSAFIFDPVGGAHWLLSPGRKTATKLPFPVMPNARVEVRHHEGGPESDGQAGKELRVERNVVVLRGQDGKEMRLEHGSEPESGAARKSLGSKEIEGVKAEGSQLVRIIPAGRIGNEKPIQIVTERWYAPELKVVLATQTRDPRSGESSYKLTKLKRSEPASDLFKPPADYKVRDVMAKQPKAPTPPAPPAPPKAP